MQLLKNTQAHDIYVVHYLLLSIYLYTDTAWHKKLLNESVNTHQNWLTSCEVVVDHVRFTQLHNQLSALTHNLDQIMLMKSKGSLEAC